MKRHVFLLLLLLFSGCTTTDKQYNIVLLPNVKYQCEDYGAYRDNQMIMKYSEESIKKHTLSGTLMLNDTNILYYTNPRAFSQEYTQVSNKKYIGKFSDTIELITLNNNLYIIHTLPTTNPVSVISLCQITK